MKWSLRLVWSGRQVFILVTRVQIPERLPPISKTLTDNQAVRVFSYPKHPLPCQPRVNRFRDMFFLMAQNTSHKVPSLTRLTLSVDTPKKNKPLPPSLSQTLTKNNPSSHHHPTFPSRNTPEENEESEENEENPTNKWRNFSDFDRKKQKSLTFVPI